MRKSKEARLERQQMRMMALIVSSIIGVVLIVAVWKGQNATALEIIKLLAGILGMARQNAMNRNANAQSSRTTMTNSNLSHS